MLYKYEEHHTTNGIIDIVNAFVNLPAVQVNGFYPSGWLLCGVVRT